MDGKRDLVKSRKPHYISSLACRRHTLGIYNASVVVEVGVVVVMTSVFLCYVLLLCVYVCVRARVFMYVCVCVCFPGVGVGEVRVFRSFYVALNYFLTDSAVKYGKGQTNCKVTAAQVGLIFL